MDKTITLCGLDDLAARRRVDAREVVRSAPPGPERDRILALLEHHPDALDRRCRPGHLTGSALVVEPVHYRFLVLYHRKLQRWLQPGGHADGDSDLARGALREATEETGIEGLRVAEPAIDLDIHVVDPPGEDAHQHHDVRFLVIAPSGAVARGNSESEALRWITMGELDAIGADCGMFRLARRGTELLSVLRSKGIICRK